MYLRRLVGWRASKLLSVIDMAEVVEILGHPKVNYLEHTVKSELQVGRLDVAVNYAWFGVGDRAKTTLSATAESAGSRGVAFLGQEREGK